MTHATLRPLQLGGLLAACLSSGACRVENNQWGGTSVGNPGEAGQVSVSAASGDGLSYTGGAMEIDQLALDNCTTGGTDFYVGAVDPTAGEPTEIPAGDWCDLTIRQTGTIALEGTGDAGGSFALTLDVPSVTVRSAGFSTDGALVLELGQPDWITADSLGLVDGEQVTIGASDPEHGALVVALVEGAALYADIDSDGALSEIERASGPVATATFSAGDTGDDEDDTGEEDDEDEDDTGS